jgi:hypothetical protein
VPGKEPAVTLESRAAEDIGGPDELADQLDSGCFEFLARTDDVVHGERQERAVLDLGREEAGVLFLRSVDLEVVGLP